MSPSNTVFLNEKNIKSLRPTIQGAKILSSSNKEFNSIELIEQINVSQDVPDAKEILEFFYISNGELAITTESETATCKAGQILICAGGVKRSYTQTSEELDAIYLSACNVVIVGFKRESIMDNDFSIVYTDENYLKHENIFKLIHDEFNGGDALGDEICASLSRALLLKLIQKQKEHTKIKFSPSKDFIGAKAYIDQNYLAFHTIEQLCDGLGINKYHLSRLFKNSINVSPARYLLQKKLEYAKYLLVETDKNIYEIAKECDLGRTENFCKLFKKNCNVTPLHYRYCHKNSIDI